jgi:hypothetical protein
MKNFVFTTKTNSTTVEIDGGNKIPINDLYTPVVIMPDDVILQINASTNIVRKPSTQLFRDIPNIDVSVDTVTIDGIEFIGTTATELYDELETLFFINLISGDSSGSNGDTAINERSLEVSSRTDLLLVEVIEGIALTNKLLRKIYNPE